MTALAWPFVALIGIAVGARLISLLTFNHREAQRLWAKIHEHEARLDSQTKQHADSVAIFSAHGELLNGVLADVAFLKNARRT